TYGGGVEQAGSADKLNTRVTTGVQGLDEILNGGLLPGRAYLLTGRPGTGKTLFGLQFLRGAGAKEKPLFISFMQTEAHLKEDAESAGIDANDISFLDLTADADVFSQVQTYDLFSPS